MIEREYMSLPWFALLRERCNSSDQTKVARALGVSRSAVCQILNGSGRYGAGTVSTDRIADRVVRTFDRFECPHLSQQAEPGQIVIVTAEECRGHAHRPLPGGSPRALQHWLACRQCPQKDANAPSVVREVAPRNHCTERRNATAL